ncbi:hypothetical protein LAZ67_X001771 [Cordylochernes scorpioides]|uniref:Uncharacterized protein n=1 Tax=Cordylochernes scorpioides TaxID=51811 RepID=A0ABY6LSS0_9ARAC|nr:hypothetical protein LAZ67_X001771 [Cordylochernes scorpioides]
MKSYPTCHIAQTLLLPIIISSNQCNMAWLTSTSPITMKSKNGSMKDSGQRAGLFSVMAFINCQKDDILPSCGHHVHPRLHNGLQNIDVGVSVHPKALLKEMGRHDITFTADNAKDHYGGRKFCVHHDRYL